MTKYTKDKTSHIQIRLSPELKEKVQERVNLEGVTISNWVERLITTALKRKPKNRTDKQ